MPLHELRISDLPMNTADAVRSLYERADHQSEAAAWRFATKFDRAFHAPDGPTAELQSANTYEPLP